MLFNSYEFIFLYLPVTFLGFFFIARHSHRGAVLWLAIASLLFYSWWSPKFVFLLLASILFNFTMGYLIDQTKPLKKAQSILVFSIAADLLLLGVFKYANFFIETAHSAGFQWNSLNIVLPLGISFFTFTQIAYLIDVYRGTAHDYNFIHYLLFVTWFPHLIAGPVLHHKQMMPQFKTAATYRPNIQSLSVGLTFFSLGLFKKVLLADQFALFANPAFEVAQQGNQLMFSEAWIGALAYTLQLYFDFSGYSDMAVGLSAMFNIRLPFNFDSPYKAASLIDFWRRWHMTLSSFLRDYLYIPLGGNRKGLFRRHFNLMVTMLLGGLWHGASWNFVLWGGLHGIYLVFNHGWRKLMGVKNSPINGFEHAFGTLITFLLVVIAWVPFRAANIHASTLIWEGMLKFDASNFVAAKNQDALLWILIGLIIIWAAPNTQQLLRNFLSYRENIGGYSRFAWKPSRSYAVITGLIFATSVLFFKKNSPFLYFQF